MGSNLAKLPLRDFVQLVMDALASTGDGISATVPSEQWWQSRQSGRLQQYCVSSLKLTMLNWIKKRKYATCKKRKLDCICYKILACKKKWRPQNAAGNFQTRVHMQLFGLGTAVFWQLTYMMQTKLYRQWFFAVSYLVCSETISPNILHHCCSENVKLLCAHAIFWSWPCRLCKTVQLSHKRGSICIDLTV